MLRSLVLVAIAASGIVNAADFSGQWTGKLEKSGGQFPAYLTLTQHGAEISGSLMIDDEANDDPLPILDARIRGTELTFEVHDGTRILKLRLTPMKNSLVGEVMADSGTSKVSFVRKPHANLDYPFERGARCLTG